MKMIKRYIYLTLAALALCTFSTHDASAATKLTPRHLYDWARQGNTQRLKQFQKYINMPDEYNNTAICLAQLNEDPKAYALLKKYGASTKVACHDDDDPICAVVAGEKLKVSPAGWLLLGVGAAAGAYAILENDSGHKHKRCPTGYHEGLKDCSLKDHPEGWTYTYVSEGKKICGKCTPNVCPVDTVAKLTDCRDYEHLDKSISEVAGYAGDAPCYNCRYQCKAGYYTDEASCKGNGYKCDSITENGITCYIRNLPEECPTDHPYETACTPAARGYQTILDIKVVGDRNCYACDYQCATGWTEGSCPAGKTCEQITRPDGVTCYQVTGCPTGTIAYESKTACETANPGYTCQENSSSSGCWIKTPKACTDYGSAYMLKSQCDETHGYTWTGSGQYAGTDECGTCNPINCPTGTSTDYTTTNSCPATGAPTLRPVGITEIQGYSAGEPCYGCIYDCNTDDGYYKSNDSCEAANPGQTCTTTVSNGITCYVPGSCPSGTSKFSSKADCETANPGYTCEENAQGSGCYYINPKICTDYGSSYMLRSQCDEAHGYTWNGSGKYAGTDECGLCNKANCPTGTSTDYSSQINCPNTGAPTLRVTGSHTTEYYSDGNLCYACDYGCNDAEGYYNSDQACTTANPGKVCTSTTVNDITCYRPNGCPTDTTYYSSEADCEAAHPGYKCVENAPGSNCYTILLEDCSVINSSYTLQVYCAGIGNFNTWVGSGIYRYNIVLTGNECGECKPILCTDHNVNYMLRSECDEANGYTWTGQGKYTGIGDAAHECGTCDIAACPDDSYTIDSDCPNNASTGAPTLRATGLSATVEGYSDGKECRKCIYDCNTDDGYYKQSSTCVDANGGKPCTETKVNGITCYVPGDCPTGTSYYA
ncbi:MAG: hypothetical protein J6W96_02160, partial [Alphaproteobacteria bacterium]|nr:hypothetical protein [Alphaproteobacteria bacterium]